MSAEDLTGKRFGRWVVLSRADDHVTAKGYHHVMWNCRCDCGTIKSVRGKSLVSGISQSCGCLRHEQLHDRFVKHGGFGTRLYAVWNSMRQRCNNKHSRAYHNYGGRGITICPEWDDYDSFRSWAISVGYDEDAERGKFTLDRIDVNGNYCPDNCRFVDMRTQTDNRRMSIVVEHDGEVHPLTVWAEILGKHYTTLWKKYKNGENIFDS